MATAVGYRFHHPRATKTLGSHRHPYLHVLVAACALAGAVIVGLGQPAASQPSIMARAIPISSVQAVPVTSSTDALEASLTQARGVLVASDGRVLDESVRTGLADLVSRGEESVRAARLLTAVAEPGSMVDYEASEGDDHLELVAAIESDAASVAAAVVAWEAEQARIAAEKEAARLAAEAAALAQTRTRTAGVAAAAGPHVEGIWTSGGQAEIDACRGSVNLPDVAGYLGGTFYAAEHWSCGGRNWAGIGTGELVSFPGYGVFQVAGRVGGLPSGSYASSLPAGYDGYYQTCMNGDLNNLHVWLLTRVG
jgi:hypothetical protein